MNHLTTYKLFEISDNSTKILKGRKLFKAVTLNDIDEVKKLIKSGADINFQERDGWSPLIYASYYGYEEIVRMLINAGANINVQTDKGETALIFSTEEGYTEIADMLIKAKADVNLKYNSTQQNALFYAVRYHRSDIADILIKTDIDLDAIDKNWMNFLENIYGGFTKEWAETYDVQKTILSKAPKLYQTFIDMNIKIHPNILKEMPHIISGNELDLY